jgi:DNA (cytosine-5)-methyltransferase 1
MFNYKWKLTDKYPAKNIDNHKTKVFTTFACGGGSSMGYKLAGYEVIAANDIDPQMAKVYKQNHKPKHFFECGIEDLLKMDLPDELKGIDLLDGSPPCSTFSIAGSREKKWGKEHKFREGQAIQVLDDLFFQFLALAEKIKPKVIVAENVKGMIQGNAKGYVVEIKRRLESMGYKTQIFLLNSATMGVPQKRERIFFIANNQGYKPLKLSFNEKPITFRELRKQTKDLYGKELSPAFEKWWTAMGRESGSLSKHHPKGSFFNTFKCPPNKVLNTLTASSGAKLTHYDKPVELSDKLLTLAGTFPTDYDFMDIIPKYLLGMSVPPVMMAQVANQIYKEWLMIK